MPQIATDIEQGEPLADDGGSLDFVAIPVYDVQHGRTSVFEVQAIGFAHLGSACACYSPARHLDISVANTCTYCRYRTLTTMCSSFLQSAAATSGKFIPVSLAFTHIRFKVTTGKGKRTKDKMILNDLSGYVRPGSFVAIMGPSGKSYENSHLATVKHQSNVPPAI